MKKSIARLVFILPAALLGFAGPLTPAEAQTHTHVSATGCKNYNATELQDIDMLTSGVRNMASSARPVICSVPRVSNVQGGGAEAYTYRVYGSNSSGSTTTCTLTAAGSNGAIRTTVSFTTSSSSYYPDPLIFGGVVVQAGDVISLICTLPKNGLGVLRGYSSVQPN